MASSQQTAQPGIYLAELATFYIPLPSPKEQRTITAVIEAQNTRIRIEEAYRNKLKLQKKGLMHDLLTGKVRVNGAEPARDDTNDLAALTTV